ncbi:uncharacterized protein [Rutidosis leptorrhynchoides]|uniref:uncharacterized protein n=1 Tax=Rutidosis leptorrhynchoides TaxID=125765 RepID=UPI003A99EE73
MELDKRGIDLHSVRCPICDNDTESVDHSLATCNDASELWRRVLDWWGVCGVQSVNVTDLLKGCVLNSSSDVGKRLWQAVTWTCVYIIWKNRNQLVFKKKRWNVPVTLNEIQIKSYEWATKRCRDKTIEWERWLHNPNSLLM